MIVERKSWAPEVEFHRMKEDEALKNLYEVRKVKKWSSIAGLMKEEFGISRRNGKQCR